MSENILFVRSEEDDEDDPWDDTLLIKAYDAALAKAKKEVLKGDPGDSTSTTTPKWRRGHFCRAKFSEDDVWYEATILKINGDSALIRYSGYGNTENVLLNDLEPSKGNSAKRSQKRKAKKSRASENYQDAMDTDTHDSFSESGASCKSRPSIHENVFPNVPEKTFLHDQKPMLPPQSNAPWGEHMPPPPPPPPGLFHGQRTPGEDETLYAMLMSWYMSGYHTGYYEGRKSTKVN